jgi:dUTP pyrophosphatase
MIKIHLSSDAAIMPRLGTEGAAGYDLFSDEDNFTLYPDQRAMFSTGVTLEMWPSIVGIIKPRSGLAVKHGLDVLAGVIDADFRGVVKVVLVNLGGDPVLITRGQAIAQILFMPVLHGVTLGDGNLSETTRGGNGFGSTDRVK